MSQHAWSKAEGLGAAPTPLEEFDLYRPDPFNVKDPSVLDSPLKQAMQIIAALMGAGGDPNLMPLGMVGGLSKLYHGSLGKYPRLQPGSMLTDDPAWAAGYTTSTPPSGPDVFSGLVHAVDFPAPAKTLETRSLHGAEAQLLHRARQVLGREPRTLREAAEAVASEGFDAILSLDANRNVTGAIPLSFVDVSEHLDPREVVAAAIRDKRQVAENLVRAITRTGQ